MAVKRFKNIVDANMENYTFLLMGEEKSGKTTIFFEIMARKYGYTGAGMLIPFEKGYSSLAELEGITVEDSDGNKKPFVDCWEDLEEITQTLVEDRFTEWNDVKALGFDTIDRLYRLAEQEVYEEHKRKYPGTPCTSINDALKGFGRGKAMQKDLVYGILQRLRGAGYGIWFLGHTKFKNVKKDGDTEGYDTMASNLNEDLYKNVAQDMDFIMQIKIDRVKGADNTLTGTVRKLIFTSDGYYTCGSRFSKFLPQEITLDALAFLSAFDDAIMKAGNWTKDELLITREQQLAKRTEAAKIFVKDEVVKRETAEKVKSLEAIYKKLPTEYQSVVANKMLEIGANKISEMNTKMPEADFNEMYDKIYALAKGLKLV